jgi:peptidoglycan/xylan/chitin deacetylase (PgdA/CDA1 family)
MVILLLSRRRIFQDLLATAVVIITVTALLPIITYGELQYLTNQLPPPNQYGAYINAGITSSSTTNNKVVILSFDDNRKGDFTYAKPILDKYGFKATFFVICGKTTDSGAMNWQDIAAMQKDGMDIESHTMTHAHLNTLSQSQLDFEIGGSKQCLASHGYNSTIFAYP